MRSLQTKSKKRKKNEKLGKIKFSTKDSPVSPDLSSLRKPIDTSVSDLYQVSKLLENGTDEVKSILSYECNIIYECRTCHSLFRSIVNLISHKREYCKKKFDVTLYRNILHNPHSSKESIIQMFKKDQTIIKDNIKNDRILRSQVSKESHKKDLSKVIDMLNKKREENMDNNFSSELTNFDTPNDQHIYLESINTNCSAVYQTVKSSNTVVNTANLMKGQLAKVQAMIDQNTVILEKETCENQEKKSDSPVQINISDEENELLVDRLSTNNLACAICNAKFSTKKTLTFHMKTLHTSQRLCYPCPFCTRDFANSWSVYRHLYKVHKKTNEQVRKLRSDIQEKAFHKETIMEDLENARTIKASTLENMITKDSDKTQKSMNHIESTVEPQSYNRRKKRLNRKITLSTPLQTIATCDESTCDETTIRQSNETLSNSTSNNMSCETEDIDETIDIKHEVVDIKSLDTHSVHVSSPEICEKNETSICVESVSSLSKEDWDMLEKDDYPAECNSIDSNNDLHKITPSITQNVDNTKLLSSEIEKQNNSVSNINLQSSEVICTSEINLNTEKIKNKKGKISNYQSNKVSLTDAKEIDVIEVQEDNSKLQSSCSTQSNENIQTSLMEKLATIANFQKLQCLLCKRRFTSMPNLRRHVAIHIGWNRYRCKLCDFKSFIKCDCVAHCNKIHNAQNNRAVIAELVIEIPQNEYTYNENIVMDVTNTEEKVNDPNEIMDITSSSELEIHVIHLNNSNTCVQNEATPTNEQQESSENVKHQGIANEKNDIDLNNSNTCIQNEATPTNEQQESSENVKHQDIANEKNDKTARVQNLAEYMMNSGSGELDDHDLKRVVMEVIFGSSDTSATAQTDSDKPAKTNNNVRKCTNANENSTASIETKKTKEASCSVSEESSMLDDNLKHQRPIRKRMKPLNNDFVYDLKRFAFRKGCALFNDSGTLHVRKKAKLYN